MSLRLDLYDLAERYSLDRAGLARLESIAGFAGEPPEAARLLPRVIGVLGAALAGFAIILWIAANWEDLGRLGRFALLQSVVLAMGLGALLRRELRVPLALL